MNSYLKNALAAALSASIAESVTIPMDTVKVRLQMQSTGSARHATNFGQLGHAGSEIKYKSMIGTFKSIISEEGAPKLWAGLTAGIQR